MKAVSKKQAKEYRELQKIYKHMSETMAPYCRGCGRSDVRISHSHLIPKSRSKSLATNPKNITYHCVGGYTETIDGVDIQRKGCHELWEGSVRDKQRLLDYHTNMEIILELDTEYYFIITEL